MSEKKLKLISEQSYTYDVTEKDDTLWIEGVFAVVDTVNDNKRVYPREVFERSLKEYTERFIKRSIAVGELGHPDTADINPERISHLIPEELKIEGNTVVGRAKVLRDTYYGKLAYSLLKNGVNLGISTRGLGDLKPLKEGTEAEPIYEVTDYMLIAFDLVVNPSSGHFVNGVLESKEFIIKEGAIIEVPRKGFYKRPRKVEVFDLLSLISFSLKEDL